MPFPAAFPKRGGFRMKKTLALLLTLVMVLSLAACGGAFENSVTALVQGNIDTLYLGKFDETYLKLVNSTEAECRQDYLDGLEMEAEYFAYYFDVEIMDDDLKEEVIELYKEIYSHSKYSVGEASKLDDKTYAIKISISPIDIVEQITEDFESGMEEFYTKYAEADPNAMSEEEYAQYDRDWAEAIINMFYEHMPTLGYKDEQSIAVQVVKGSNDLWVISDNDMASIDNLIIYYP